MVSSIHDYITRNDETGVKHWLNNCVDTDELDHKQRTPIFTAVQTGNMAIAKLILKKGCNTNIPSSEGLYPLQLAIYNKHYKFAELLLTHKADPNKQNPGGLNSIAILCSLGSADTSKLNLLQSLLKAGGKVNTTNVGGDTSLHLAARSGCHAFVETLISHKASVDQVNLEGENALHCAIQSGDEPTVSRLLKLVGKMTAKNKEGQTPIDVAKAFAPKLVNIIEAAMIQRIPWQEIKPEGKWPIPRCNFSASEYNSRWYIYGGENDFVSSSTVYDDMHFFHGAEKEWRLLAPRGREKPPALCRHTTLIFGSNLYLFGGTTHEKTFNDIWILDLDKMEWRLQKPEGPYLIRPRAGHTMTKISDTKFVVIGGSCDGDFFADVHVFDIETRIWERISPSSTPSKRHLHSAVFYDDSIYVFGGCNNEEAFNDVMVLDITNWCWFELEVRGTVPPARYGQTSLLINNRALLFYGGMDEDGESLADIRTFDLLTYTWIKYDSSSSNFRQPLHRAGHQMEIVGTSIYAFGGNSVFCMHELLPNILENQTLPIPEVTVQEKKAVSKPPIPEKPVIPVQTDKENKLHRLISELISLTRDQKFPPNHPLLLKCNEIEACLEAEEKKSLPPLPDKPNKSGLGPKLPEKPQQAQSDFMKRRPPSSSQITLPSLVLQELDEKLEERMNSGPNSPKVKAKPKPPAKPQSTSNLPLAKSQPNVPVRSPSPNEEETHIQGLSTSGPTVPPRGSPRGRRIGRNATRGNRPPGAPPRPGVGVRGSPPTRKPQLPRGGSQIGSGTSSKRVSVAGPRPGRSQSSAPALEAKPKSNFSMQTLRAPSTIDQLPSLMIKPEDEMDATQENANGEIQKMIAAPAAHYILPPPPANPVQHYEELAKLIPARNRVILSNFKDKKDKQVYEITNEILTTEEGYLKDLAILIGIFKKPLEQEYEGCIPPHYLDVIFCNAEKLFELHQQLFKELLLAEKQEQSIGMAFMKVINLFPQYNNYCTNQLNAIETVEKLQKSNIPFVDFLKCNEAFPECNRQDIHSYLIKPFQRITRYPLLLKELLKNLSKSSKDYQHLEDSITRIDAIVKDANEEKRVSDTVIKMIEIQKAFVWQGEEGQLRFSPDCKFLMDAKFKEWNSKSQKTAKRHFFLFNDMVVIAKEMSSKKFKKISTIPLDSCIIWDIKTGSSEIPKNIKFAFSIVRTEKTSENNRLIMCAKTKQEKEFWINSINSAISAFLLE